MNKLLKIKLIKFKEKYDEGMKKLSDSNIISNLREYTKISKEIFPIKKIVELFKEYLNIEKEIKEINFIFKSDLELKSELKIEINKLKKKSIEIIEKIKIEISKKEKLNKIISNTIVEIRSAAGGEESELFSFELCEAYFKFLKRSKIKFEILTKNSSNSNSYSLVSFLIKNKEIYSKFQFESGVHRVQRIPKTETQGRVHTSTVTVAVLMEKTETEVKILSEEIRIDTFRSSGAGGQHVNTTNSAIRITHLPTGLVVSCQDGRSQHDNKSTALKVLRSRLFNFFETKMNKEFSKKRSEQVGKGMRSEKIRTYNFQQNRVTDHRINFSYKNIEKIMQGYFDPLWDRLIDWKKNKIK